jgi:hypothetical protein
VLLAFLGTGCAPAVPTVDPAMVQGSAVAAASTMIAMTQAAIPTATDTPVPSPTPLPIPTLPPLPTIALPTIQPTKTGGDDCDHVFDMASTGGARTPVKINNLTKGSVNLSIGMYAKNVFGQCGYLGYSIPKGQSISIQMPSVDKGPCWYGYAWVNGSDPSTSQGGPFCWNGTDKWELDIGPEVIRASPP